jgi:hypothetical protein
MWTLYHISFPVSKSPLLSSLPVTSGALVQNQCLMQYIQLVVARGLGYQLCLLLLQRNVVQRPGLIAIESGNK